MKKKSSYRYNYTVPILATVILFFLVTLTIFNAWYRYRIDAGALMAHDIQELSEIFERINETAGILDFDYQKNWINFLTIKEGGFVGSEVGTLNLMYPKKWHGPYMKDNPTIQGKEYQVVHTKKGYFIVPGEGVRLPNGKVIGVDLIFNEDSDIERMALDDNQLRYRGKKLMAPIKTGGETQRKMLLPEPEAI